MAHAEKEDERAVFLCGECQLGFADGQTAKACEAYDKKYSACSLEIAKKAIRTPYGRV